jgi:predicted transposase/invertase (TIGR01784 family)
MKFIKTDDEEVMNVIAERNPQMKKAVGFLKELSADERTRMLYEEQEMARHDMASRLDWARKEEREKTKIETRREDQSEFVRNSLTEGLDIETIMRITKITREEIEEFIMS